MGGAIYTVNGIKPFCDDVLFITTAGLDFDQYYGDYFRTNHISTSGIQFVLPMTEYTILEYSPDGRWWEYSKYGPEYEAKWAETALINAEFVTQYASAATQGIYFESAVRESVWEKLDAIRTAAPKAKIMWELSTGDCGNPEVRDAVLSVIEKLDIYSLNMPESMAFFNTNSVGESIEAIIRLGRPCFFRVGEDGAYMITNGKAWYAPAVDSDLSVDATGCGNCSTGTALYGFCEGLHPLMTVIKANLAASLNALQYGPYPQFTEQVRIDLNDRAHSMFEALFTEQ